MDDNTVTSSTQSNSGGGATADDINNTLQNTARQIGLQTKSLTDIITAVEGNVSDLADSVADLLTDIQSQTLGGVLAVANNGLDTTPVQVWDGGGGNVDTLTFHNPGTNTLYVYPETASFGANAPTLSTLGGSLQLLPGAYLVLRDQSRTSWGAFADSGTNNPLTVMAIF